MKIGKKVFILSKSARKGGEKVRVIGRLKTPKGRTDIIHFKVTHLKLMAQS